MKLGIRIPSPSRRIGGAHVACQGYPSSGSGSQRRRAAVGSPQAQHGRCATAFSRTTVDGTKGGLGAVIVLAIVAALAAFLILR